MYKLHVVFVTSDGDFDLVNLLVPFGFSRCGEHKHTISYHIKQPNAAITISFITIFLILYICYVSIYNNLLQYNMYIYHI